MCRCMDWTGVSILMNRWSSKGAARTGRDGQWPGGSRRRFLSSFTMSCVMNRRSFVEWLDKKSAGSRKPEPNSLFSGSGALVR